MKIERLIPERYLLMALQVLVAATFFVPLITNSLFYFPFIVPRNFFFRLLAELALTVYVLLVLRNRSYLPRRHWSLYLYFGFLAVLTLSSSIGGNFTYGFWSNFERMEGLITLYYLGALLLACYGAFRERFQWERLLQISLFAAICVSFVGLSQYFGVNLLLASSGGGRISSTLGNATYLSSYLLIHFFIALYFLLKNKDPQDIDWYKYGFIALDAVLIFLQTRYNSQTGVGIVSQIFSHVGLWLPLIWLQLIALSHFWLSKNPTYLRWASILFNGSLGLIFLLLVGNTQTRGALVGLGLAAVVAYLLLLFRRQTAAGIKVIGSGLIALMVASVVLIFVYSGSSFVQSQPILSKIASISVNDATTQTRLVTWQAGWKGFTDKPVFGWGVESFYRVFNKYFPTVIYKDEGTPLWFDRPHNIIVQYAVEGGALGVALFLAFAVSLALAAVRKLKRNYLGIFFVSFLVGYIGQNLFVFDSINSYIPFYLLVGFLLFLTSGGTDSDQTNASLSPATARPTSTIVGALLVILAASWFVWYVNVRAVTTNTKFVVDYNKLSAATPEEYANASYDIFDTIERGPFMGRFELLTVYSENLVDLIRNHSLPDSALAPLVARTDRLFSQLNYERQDDARLYVFHMNMLFNALRLDPSYSGRVLALGEKALPLSPTRPQIYYLTGRAHMTQGDYDLGLADFKTAVGLAPDIFDAHWNLFAAYVTVSDLESAHQELALLKRTQTFTPDNYIRTAAVYITRKYYDDAIEMLRSGLSISPDVMDLHAALAETYALDGRNDEARATAQKMLELFPQTKTQVDEFLKRLDSGEYLKN